MKYTVVFFRAAYRPCGVVGTIVSIEDCIEAALDNAFRAFNRGSGRDVEFAGPSASVGDLFLVDDTDGKQCKRIFQIASCGFTEL
jgi:hypothetical protein